MKMSKFFLPAVCACTATISFANCADVFNATQTRATMVCAAISDKSCTNVTGSGGNFAITKEKDQWILSNWVYEGSNSATFICTRAEVPYVTDLFGGVPHVASGSDFFDGVTVYYRDGSGNHLACKTQAEPIFCEKNNFKPDALSSTTVNFSTTSFWAFYPDTTTSFDLKFK